MNLDTPKARASDPETSHAAAQSISRESISETQIGILVLLCEFGPLTDEALAEAYWVSREKFISPSGLRTRRHELFLKGYVRVDGKGTLESGREGMVWRITEDGVLYLESMATT